MQSSLFGCARPHLPTEYFEKNLDCASMAGIRAMAKICDITGKKSQMGGRYSNRVRATQFNPCGSVRRQPNLQKKRVYVAELDKTVTLKISTKGLRTLTKNGAYRTLKEARLI